MALPPVRSYQYVTISIREWLRRPSDYRNFFHTLERPIEIDDMDEFPELASPRLAPLLFCRILICEVLPPKPSNRKS